MILSLIVLNVLCFLLEGSAPAGMLDYLALWPIRSGETGTPGFHLPQLVTYSLLHANLAHLVFNMFGLYVFGRQTERVLGLARTLMLYTVSVVSGGVVQLAVAAWSSGGAYPVVGASAGVFGVLVAYALLFPRQRVILLFPPIPMPAWLFATGYAAIELLLGVSGREPGVAHFAHLGGMIGAIALIVYWSHGWPLHAVDDDQWPTIPRNYRE